MRRWADLWGRMFQRFAPGTRTRSEAHPPAPEDDELARLIRWSLRSTIGREDPPATAWWRIRDELLAPPRPLYRRWVGNLARALDWPRLVQGAVTVALLVFVFTAVLEQPLSPWSIRPIGVTPTPGQVYRMRVVNGASEGLLSGAHAYPGTGSQSGRGYKDIDRAVSPELTRLTRVRDVAAWGFVSVSARGLRVLINPAEDELITELSKDMQAKAHASGEAEPDPALVALTVAFPSGVILSGPLD